MTYCHLSEADAKRIQSTIPQANHLQDLANLFKIFGDETRVRIMAVLLEEELCVHDISSLLDLSQSATSHQLRTLRHAKLVKSRREGRSVYYSLADAHVEKIFKQGFEHVIEGV